MGVCVGKGANSQNQVLDHQHGRELSANKAEPEASEVAARPAETRGGAVGSSEGTLLDLLPDAPRRVSLCGTCSDQHQKGFADKSTQRTGGDESLGSLRVGYACKKGLKPESPNQDDFCIWRAGSTSIYGVFDGHGPYGHDVSGFVQDALPRSFVKEPSFQTDPAEALSAAFPATHKLCAESQTQGHFDCTLSGTTATLAMHRNDSLYLAHVGDSRAVLARRRDGALVCEELTTDHKPTCEVERRRIQVAGGQVRRLEGDIPYRVFLNGKMYPGLSMTRSIGDTVGSTAGVTSEPEVRTLQVQRDWRFLLLCSDGVWEFISSQEAVDIAGRYAPSDAHKAAEALALEAWNRWIAEEENIVDDITVICAWFYDD